MTADQIINELKGIRDHVRNRDAGAFAWDAVEYGLDRILARHAASDCEDAWKKFVEFYETKTREMYAMASDKSLGDWKLSFRGHVAKFCCFCGGKLPEHRFPTEKEPT